MTRSRTEYCPARAKKWWSLGHKVRCSAILPSWGRDERRVCPRCGAVTQLPKMPSPVPCTQAVVGGMSGLEYSPVYITRDGTVYHGQHNEFFSHHDIGDGQCACVEPRRGTMFTLDGERSVWCNVCHQNVPLKKEELYDVRRP